MPLPITEIQNRIDKIVDRLGLKIDSHQSIISDSVDSLEFVELTMELEKEFDTVITYDEAEHCATLADFANVIYHHRSL